MFFNNVGIVNAATTPITPRVINTSARVNATLLPICRKPLLREAFSGAPPRKPHYDCVLTCLYFLSFVMFNSLTFVFTAPRIKRDSEPAD